MPVCLSIHLPTESDFEDHAMVGLAGANPAGGPAGWRPREGLMLQFKSKGRLPASALWLGEVGFVLLTPSTDWVGPTRYGRPPALFQV